MKKFLSLHPNVIIGTLATVFIAILVIFYLWAINGVFAQMDRALVSPVPQSATGFNLKDAAQLDLRGLAGTATATPAPVVTSTSSSAQATSTQ